MAKAPLFPNFHDVRPTFIVGKLKDADIVGVNPVRVIAQFDPVIDYRPDLWGRFTLPVYGDSIYIDMEARQPIDPATFEKTDNFNPTRVAEAAFNLQQEIADRDNKIKTMDDMIKTLTVKGDPRVLDANRRIASLEDDLRSSQKYGNEQRIRNDNLHDDNKRLIKIQNDQNKELIELRTKVIKLTGDLLNTANERDNKVEELAKQKLPNLQRDVQFYKDRAKELAAENGKLKDELESVKEEAELDAERAAAVSVPTWRLVRKLQRKLHKAGGKLKAVEKAGLGRFNEVLALQKEKAELENKLDTVNKAYKIERDAVKDLCKLNMQLEEMEQVPVLETIEPLLTLPDGKTVNITLNVAHMTVAEMNNYN